jgi:hypothetical protein
LQNGQDLISAIFGFSGAFVGFFFASRAAFSIRAARFAAALVTIFGTPETKLLTDDDERFLVSYLDRAENDTDSSDKRFPPCYNFALRVALNYRPNIQHCFAPFQKAVGLA